MKRIIFTIILFVSSIFELSSQDSNLLDAVIIKKNKTGKLAAKFLRLYGDSLNDRGEYESAIEFYNKSLVYNSTSTNKYELASAYIGIADSYDDLQEFRKAVDNYKKAFNVVKEIQDTQLIVKNLSGIAASYFQLEIVDSSIVCLKEALIYAERDEKRYSNYLNAIYNTLGLSYNFKVDFPNSLNCFLKAIAVAEKYRDSDGLSMSYNNIGNLYGDMGNQAQGFFYYKKALQSKIRSTHALTNIAAYFFEIKSYDSTMFYLNKCIDIDFRNKDRSALSADYIIKGNVFKAKSKYDSALFYYESSIKMAEEIEDISAIENSTFNMIELYLELNKIDKAKLLAHKNLESLLKSGDLDFIADTYKQLTEVYKKSGNYIKAFEYQQQFILYKDSALAANKDIEIKKIELTAEYNKKSSNDSLLHAHETLLNNINHESEINKQRVVLFGFIFILIIVAVFSIWVYRRYKISQRQKEIINLQKNEMYNQKLIVEEKQKEILDSIHYAKRIQYALIAHKDFIDENLPENFIYFNPKDIVSGDFYWATKQEDFFYLAICDSTGHGVPGAFMSLLNIGFLSEAINEKGILEPNKVFDFVRMRLEHSISKDGQKDGFDGILLRYNLKTKEMDYAAANNAPVLISENSFVELPKDRMPVGVGERKEQFNLYTIDAKSGDRLFFYTDGFADQFGGPKGKKYKYRKLNDLLCNSVLPVNELTVFLSDEFQTWRGALEQVDDVCIIGLKV